MNITPVIPKQKNGKTLTNAKRLIIISKLVELLCEGYQSTNKLSKILGVARATIETYRPLADEIIGKTKLDRNVIRNLQVQRTYQLIERLMNDLDTCNTIKDKSLIYNQIAKFSQHLALITGLNIETTVNVDHQKLVIIRANNSEKPTQNIIDSIPVTNSIVST